MKNRNLWKLALGLSLLSVPIAGGCRQDNTNQPAVGSSGAITTSAEPIVYQASAAPGASATETAVTESALVDAPALTNLIEAPIVPISTNQPVPPKVNLSYGAAELAKLAGSGVDQGVMLAYVTNSQSTFNLSAEEIIYLNDLGIPGPVITAMIQRDQVLIEQGKAALLAASAPVTNLPSPAPADVAPQPVEAPAEYVAEPPPPPPAEQVTYSTFYDSLAPYGTWVYVSGYGRCWRPTVVVVNPTWQPYYDGGRWVYSDCGWYWMSDYSWGWAPFHYGRWFRHAHWGWCWAPDLVWGPSWVSWRYTDVYCGWAPLPPGCYFSFSIGLTWYGRPCHDWDDWGHGHHHYRFVAWRDFDNRRVSRHGVPPRDADSIYRNSRVANRFAARGNNVVNEGIPRERVVSATRRDFKQVTIRETGRTERLAGGRTERLSGNTLTVYRPAVPHREPGGSRLGDASSRQVRGGAAENTVGGVASAPSAPPARRAPTAVPRTLTSPTSRDRAGSSVSRSIAASPEATVSTVPPKTPARPSSDPSQNEGAGPGVTSRPSAPNRQVTPATPSVSQSGSDRTVSRPSAPSRAPTPAPAPSRSSGSMNRTPQAAPSAPRSEAAPSVAPTVRTSPDTSSSRAQVPARTPSSTRSYPTPTYTQPAQSAPQAPRSVSAPTYVVPQRPTTPTYSAPSRPTTVVPRATPAPTYVAPQRPSVPAYSAPPRAVVVPRSTPTPSYSAPQRSIEVPRYTPAPAPQRPSAPAPSVSRPSSTPSRSYSPPSPSRSTPTPAPARSAPSAPSSSSRGSGARS